MKLKYKDIPRIKKVLLQKQGFICPICDRDLNTLKPRDICLDHNHTNGKVRAVLCRGCNSMEGKVYRLYVRLGLRNQGVEYTKILIGLSKYTSYKETKYIHPKYKERKK
jgi:hypothetical protein